MQRLRARIAGERLRQVAATGENGEQAAAQNEALHHDRAGSRWGNAITEIISEYNGQCGDKATIEGADVNVKAVLGGGFVLGAATGYTHTDVKPGDHWEISPVNVMPDVPLFNANLSVTYEKELSDGYRFTAGLDNGYVGSRYTLSFLYPYQSTGHYVKLPSYDLTNLRVGIESSRGWGISAFVTNLTNKHAALENMFQETEPSAAFSRVMTNQPLTAGFNLTYKM